MLKQLWSELGKSLSRRRHAVATGSIEQLDRWKQEFSSADEAHRRELTTQLDSWIAAHPERKQGWVLRGDWQLKRGDLDSAERDYRKALQIDPISPSAQEGLGLTLLHARRLDDAYLHLETAHKLMPADANILNHWGLVALEMGNLRSAFGKFERAVERDVRNAHAWHNLGLVALKLGRTAHGIRYLQRAIEVQPAHGLAHSNLALAHRDAEQLQDALAMARRAAELKPDNARVWVVLADLLIDAGDLPAASAALRRALELNPNDANAQIALGKLHAADGRHAEAEAAYRAALALSPGNPEAEGGLGQLEILLGHYAEGWDHYESRRRAERAPVRPFPQPEWQGEDLSGRTLLVHAEQGLGDVILFASCLPDVIERAGHVVIETYPRLAGLFARSFPMATVIGRDVDDLGHAWLQDLPPIDRQIAAGSLPRWLRRSADAFPRHAGYLRADAERVSSMRQRLAGLGPRPKIGIAWRGGLIRSARTQRSLDLRELLAALQPLDVELVSLQYGDVQAEVDRAVAETGVPLAHWPEVLVDQDDAAALTTAVNAVLSVCQTQAHLTGALGHPGCILVPANPNWRYGSHGDAIPWYPSLHLVRQADLSSWSQPLAEAADWLRARLPGV